MSYRRCVEHIRRKECNNPVVQEALKHCHDCNRSFKRHLHLQVHDKAYHPYKDGVACDNCEMKLATFALLEEHEDKCWETYGPA